MPTSMSVPETVADEAALEELLSRPSAELIRILAGVTGDLAVVGVGGKVGPTLARMAKRARPDLRVIGIARFTEPGLRRRLESWGVDCVACDLTDRAQVARLPAAANLVYMAGRKFGTAEDPPLTWAMNALVPGQVAEHYAGARFVAFSTLCVYPFAAVAGPGSGEGDALTPSGEYANSCVARERIWQYASARHGSPGRLARLNYAIDLRYGVLHDIALRVRDGLPIDLRTGVANVIWQGDASDHILRCLVHGTVPATPINIGAPQPARVRAVAQRFGAIFGKEPRFQGREEDYAWHCDCSLQRSLFGAPAVDLDTMIRWNAAWIAAGLPVHAKPTRYAERAGAF